MLFIKEESMKKRTSILAAILVIVFAATLIMAVPAMAWWEANTTVTLSGPTEPVPENSLVTLTVTETNDGSTAYWMGPAWVELNPGGYILDYTMVQSGDYITLGILNPGETWVWEVEVLVTEDTLFEAIGHGMALGQEDITWGIENDQGEMAWPGERAELMVFVIPPPPAEGLTPGFWKTHPEAWADTGYSPEQTFSGVFGVGPEVSLMAALEEGGGHEEALGRHAVAELLNAAHPDVDYTIGDPADVIAMVQAAYAAGEYEETKDLLESYNETDFELY
jgi:hypothetical protein